MEFSTLFGVADNVGVLELAEVGHKVTVGEDDALGQTGGAARVRQRRHAVRVGGRRPRRPAGHCPSQQFF